MDTYWHERDPMVRGGGFNAKRPETNHTRDRLISHIRYGDYNSPYISLTRSYGVALAYARMAKGEAELSKENPAYVYKIELDVGNHSNSIMLIDPVKYIAQNLVEPWSTSSYQHNGSQDLVKSLVDTQCDDKLLGSVPQPPHLVPVLQRKPLPAIITDEMATLVFALRDAEILAVGFIPSDAVAEKYRIISNTSLHGT